MNFYKKRNIFHPIIEVGGQPIQWQRVGTSGVLATEDAATIKVLDKAAAESRGAVSVLEEKQYVELLAAEKKIAQPTQGRTFLNKPYTVDRGRSAALPAQSPTPPPASAPPVAGPAATKAEKKPRRAVASPPVVTPPPGISGVADPE